MTKPLIALPCTARELENALHAVCDQGLWDAKIKSAYCYHENAGLLQTILEIEAKGETNGISN